jgi:hypothetical protein
MYDPRALPQRNPRCRPARNGRPKGRFGYLEVVYPCDVFDDAVACVVPNVHVEGKMHLVGATPYRIAKELGIDRHTAAKYVSSET